MKILVVGSGAREHAIVKALLSEQVDHDITVAPGNAGIAQDAPCVTCDILDPDAVLALADGIDADLVVIGPEAPLVAGVADVLRDAGIAVFGPNQNAAVLEGSKAFAKRIMDAAGVPTGRAITATTLLEAETALDDYGVPYVVKADGLAAGKGVLVTHDRDAAVDHAAHYLTTGSVLIEEFLDGPEVSLFMFADGHDVLPLSPAQDFKRLANNDEGPNTGGMGAYSPLPWLADQFGSEDAFVTEVIETIALPTIRQLEQDGTPFQGLLYCGLILTSKGIRVIEFNARFGDPETQVVLPRMVTPLSELMMASAQGTLSGMSRPEFSSDATVTVVLASENYPDTPITGRVLTGLSKAEEVDGVHIAHAATIHHEDHLVANGGRVLSVVATGSDFAEARSRAYESMNLIGLEGGQFRTDIAARVVS